MILSRKACVFFCDKTANDWHIVSTKAIIINMSVSVNGGNPQIIHFNRVFHYKPSNLGYPYFWKHSYMLFASYSHLDWGVVLSVLVPHAGASNSGFCSLQILVIFPRLPSYPPDRHTSSGSVFSTYKY